MIEQRERIKSLLRDMKNASQLLHQATRNFQPLKTNFDKANFMRTASEMLASIAELQFDLFDLDPTLIEEYLEPSYLKPSLDAIDLNDTVESLLFNDTRTRKNAIAMLQSYMLDKTADQFARACELGTGGDFAQTWWQQQPKPFLPVVSVYNKLRHKRYCMRYLSAKLLEVDFGVKIWNDARDDLSLEIADRWFNSWLNRSTTVSKVEIKRIGNYLP